MEPDGINRVVSDTASVGLGTFVWHYTVILDDVIIGQDCNIGSRVEIGKSSHIGNRTRVGSGTFLPPGSQIGADVFIGPNVTFTDDKFPKCGNTNYYAQPPVVEDHASIGAGVVILPGVRIGAHALVGAGSIITKDVPAHAVVSNTVKTRTYTHL